MKLGERGFGRRQMLKHFGADRGGKLAISERQLLEVALDDPIVGQTGPEHLDVPRVDVEAC